MPSGAIQTAIVAQLSDFDSIMDKKLRTRNVIGKESRALTTCLIHVKRCINVKQQRPQTIPPVNGHLKITHSFLLSKASQKEITEKSFN